MPAEQTKATQALGTVFQVPCAELTGGARPQPLVPAEERLPACSLRPESLDFVDFQMPSTSYEISDFIPCQDFKPGLLDINQNCIFQPVLIYIYLMLKVICDHLSVSQHMESVNNRFQPHAVKKDCVFTRHDVVYWVLIITN